MQILKKWTGIILSAVLAFSSVPVMAEEVNEVISEDAGILEAEYSSVEDGLSYDITKDSDDEISDNSENTEVALDESEIIIPSDNEIIEEKSDASEISYTGNNGFVLGAKGYEEGACVTFKEVKEADGYTVSYSYAKDSEFIVIDNELIRKYPDNYRADILGIKGDSTVFIKVQAVKVNQDGSIKEVVKEEITTEVTVTKYSRSGFAFANKTYKDLVGAYNSDGTLRDNALVVYLTNHNKNNLNIELTDKSGNTVSCNTIQDVFDCYKYEGNERPLNVRVIGNVTIPDRLVNGDLFIDNESRYKAPITLEGVGEDAVINGFGLRVSKSKCVELRNLAVINCMSKEGDSIGVDSSMYIWVHDMETYYGYAGMDDDQKKGDGSLDCRWSNYVTFSYNHFVDSGKCNLLSVGISDYGNRITYDHNWYDHTDSRNPRVRYYTAHVYNNYYDGVSNYGIGATQGSSVFSEKNYFRNVKVPMAISFQGSEGGSSLSKEPGGIIKAFDNIIVGGNYLKYSENNKYNFDAYEVTERSEKVPDTVVANCLSDGTVMGKDDFIKKGTKESVFYDYGYADETMRHYNNFDTAEDFYTYETDAAESVPDVVTKKAGTLGGLVIPYTFDNAKADGSGAIDPVLEALVRNYETKLVSIGGLNGYDSGESGAHGGQVIPSSGATHDFIESKKVSEYFSFYGFGDSSKRTSAEYNGEQKYISTAGAFCLSGRGYIKFKTEAVMQLNVIGATNFANKIVVDGETLESVNGIFSKGIMAGEHIITPCADEQTTFLFMIDVVPNNGEHTIVINNNNGTENITLQLNGGEQLTKEKAPTPKKDGYSFTGWVDEKGNDVVLPYTVFEDVTITARFMKDGYKTTGTNISLDIENYQEGEIKTTTDINGFKITPRSDKAWLVEGGDATIGGVTYSKRINTKGKTTSNGGTITFENKGITTFVAALKGTTDRVVNLYCDDVLVTSFTATTTGVLVNYPLTKDGTYKITFVDNAVFVYDLKVVCDPSYLLTYNTLGGKMENSKVTVLPGAKITKPEDPVKEGFVFGGWYEDYECTKSYKFGGTIESDKFLFAKWLNPGEKPENNDFKYDDIEEDTDYEGVTERLSIEGAASVSTPLVIKDQYYTGLNIMPKFSLKYGKTLLLEGTDYTVSYRNNVDVSTTDEKAAIVITGSGLYKGEKVIEFNIIPKKKNALKAYASAVLKGTNKDILSKSVLVFDGSKLLTEGTDYEVDTSLAVTDKKGTTKVKVKGIGRYSGEVTASVPVIELNSSKNEKLISVVYVLNDSMFTYDGTNHKVTAADLCVTDSNGSEVSSENYTISIRNAKEAGYALVTVKGKGTYKGAVNVAVKIKPAENVLSVAPINKNGYLTYTGKLLRPKLKVTTTFTVNGKAKTVILKENKDFTVKYVNNLKAGEASYVITGIGNYEGSKEVKNSFEIKPLEIKKVTVKKDSKTGAYALIYNKHVLYESIDYSSEEVTVKNKKAVKFTGLKNFTSEVIK